MNTAPSTALAVALFAALQGCSYLAKEPDVTVGEGHRFVQTGDVPLQELRDMTNSQKCEGLVMTAMPEGMPYMELGICYATVSDTGSGWNDSLRAIDELRKCMCENAGVTLLLDTVKTEPAAQDGTQLLKAKARLVFWGVQ